jgi:hypothetical protein
MSEIEVPEIIPFSTNLKIPNSLESLYTAEDYLKQLNTISDAFKEKLHKEYLINFHLISLLYRLFIYLFLFFQYFKIELKIPDFAIKAPNIAEILLQGSSFSKILSRYEIMKLEELCGLKITESNLVFRASTDGFEAANFHAKCDSVANTLSIIKSKEGFVFGGFTSLPWQGSVYMTDEKAFLFSLKNDVNSMEKIPLIPSRSSHAIYANNSFGPCFGSYEITIRNMANKNNNSTSKLGSTFKSKDENFLTLAETEKFQVDEIEVFAIIT